MWTGKISTMGTTGVGSVALQWQWKRNQGKQSESEQNRGMVIFAIDTPSPFGLQLQTEVDKMLA
eukprot:3176317-Pyramimonas_sp.AAC.1